MDAAIARSHRPCRSAGQMRYMPLPRLPARARPHCSEMSIQKTRIHGLSILIRPIKATSFMAFNILGINHKTAPVDLREKVAFTEERLLAALRARCGRKTVWRKWSFYRPATELRCIGPVRRAAPTSPGGSRASSRQRIWSWRQACINHQESRAVEHAFSVASGLRFSMVLGEVQILGQLKDAYRVAQEQRQHRSGC